MKTNNNGLVLRERGDVVVIATGLRTKSTNSKTGAMVQVYILHRHLSPVDAVNTGADAAICGNCPHRGQVGVAGTRRCYVQVGRAPQAIWKAYQRGSYRKARNLREVADVMRGRIVRLGAYGDPAFMGQDLVRAITSTAAGYTGYTHQWRRTSAAWLKPFVMASCDSQQDANDARANGWRYFRVAPKGDTTRLAREISCPASAEAGKRTTCSACRLCDGARYGAADPRANVVIQDHSVIARSNPLIQINL